MKNVNLLLTLAISAFAFSACEKQNTLTSNEMNQVLQTADLSNNADKNKGIGAVYLIDNNPTENHLLVYHRAANGMLSTGETYATGGKGSGSGLGSQGSVVLDKSNRFLFVVNAGSNDITTFSVGGNGIKKVDKKPSDGMMPVSLTIHGEWLYVLNAGTTANIHGFHVEHGVLHSIPGSSRTLSTNAPGPAQVQFNEKGNALVVTEKATNTIDVFSVENGRPGTRASYPSVGETPFGFAFRNDGTLIVSDAYGGASGKSALTSYSLTRGEELKLITGPVPTMQTAACWVVITGNGKYTYTSNAGSATISGYSIDHRGALTRLNQDGVTAHTGSSPSDIALSNESHFLYCRNGGSNSISIFRVEPTGALTNVGVFSGLPAGTAGIAAE